MNIHSALQEKWKQILITPQTFSIGGKSFEETFSGAPTGTLTQFWKPASSSESLSISPSTYHHHWTVRIAIILFFSAFIWKLMAKEDKDGKSKWTKFTMMISEAWLMSSIPYSILSAPFPWKSNLTFEW